MEDFAYVVRYVYHWILEHPVGTGLVIAGLFVLQWLLNRKTALEKESDRVVRELTQGSKGKYDDLRPLK